MLTIFKLELYKERDKFSICEPCEPRRDICPVFFANLLDLFYAVVSIHTLHVLYICSNEGEDDVDTANLASPSH